MEDVNDRLLQVLRDFVGRLVTDYDLARVLDHLCQAVVEVLPASGAGVAVAAEDGGLRFVAATDRRVGSVERFQDETGEGPCATSFERGEAVIIHDVQVERTPWPRFGAAARAAGIHLVAGFPMGIDDARVGALDLYSIEPVEFGEPERAVAEIFASIAASYVLNVRRQKESGEVADQLRHALSHRVVVEQAKGILAGRHRISIDEALTRLRSHARNSNRQLREVALEVVEGTLDL